MVALTTQESFHTASAATAVSQCPHRELEREGRQHNDSKDQERPPRGCSSAVHLPPGMAVSADLRPGLVMLWPTQDAFVEHRLEATQHRPTADALLHYLDHPCDPPRAVGPSHAHPNGSALIRARRNSLCTSEESPSSGWPSLQPPLRQIKVTMTVRHHSTERLTS
jgi:hypothetical protein